MAFKRSAVRSRLSPPRQATKPRLCGLVLPTKKMRIRIPREKAGDVLQPKYISGLVRFPGALKNVVIALNHHNPKCWKQAQRRAPLWISLPEKT